MKLNKLHKILVCIIIDSLFVIPWTVASQAFLANFLKVYKSGIFRDSIDSCNHCHNPALGYLHHLRKFPYA